VLRWVRAAQRLFSSKIASWAEIGREITQIYEGTNQIQKVVMARALLRG
jgi:alkylation response protein AidB-like acyl-CoA dehydrogenase